MRSISAERRSVNAKALFTAGLAKAQAEVVKRLGEEVGTGLDESIDQVLGRGAYVRRKHVGPWVEVAAVCHAVSYTHLGVYKRQTYTGFLVQRVESRSRRRAVVLHDR